MTRYFFYVSHQILGESVRFQKQSPLLTGMVYIYIYTPSKIAFKSFDPVGWYFTVYSNIYGYIGKKIKVLPKKAFFFCESSPSQPLKNLGCVLTSGAPEFSMEFPITIHLISMESLREDIFPQIPIMTFQVKQIGKKRKTSSCFLGPKKKLIYVIDCCTTLPSGTPGNSLSPQGRSFFIALRADKNLEVGGQFFSHKAVV